MNRFRAYKSPNDGQQPIQFLLNPKYFKNRRWIFLNCFFLCDYITIKSADRIRDYLDDIWVELADPRGEVFRSSRSPDSRKAIYQFPSPLAARGAEYFLSKFFPSISLRLGLGTFVFWAGERPIIFFHSDVYGPSDVSRPRRFFSRDSRFVSADYAGENSSQGRRGEGRRKVERKFLIKRFHTRNIRHRGKNFLFLYFFFLIEFFSRNTSSLFFFRLEHMPLNNFARIPEHPHIYSCRSGFFPSVCLSAIASTVDRCGVRFATLRKAVVWSNKRAIPLR